MLRMTKSDFESKLIVRKNLTNLIINKQGNIFAFRPDEEYRSYLRFEQVFGETEIESFLLNPNEIDAKVKNNEFKRVITNDNLFYSFKDSKLAKNEIARRIIKYMVDTNNFSGESLHQCDSGLIEAPTALSDIIDDILEVTFLHQLEGLSNEG